MFLNTKEEVKYFLTTIGDCIKHKKEELVYYVPEIARDFITELELYYKGYFGRIYIIININLSIEVLSIKIVG